ncbi:hypothetical protein [Roseimicrobium gellanilyticum]|nr:hypothetical protein [Roseimicrobium gellanilyticum]
MISLHRARLVASAITVCVTASFAAPPPSAFREAACEDSYTRHVQGICTNEKDAIYWSWTESLVKTDLDGHILKSVPAPDHQGDLCHHDGKVYVAVNLGKFNQPAGKADSWVFVYDGDTLAELARHPVQEAVHGAGGMTWKDGHFFIVGGLPPDGKENYVYEYDEKFTFVKRHVLDSGYTLMGIQTVEYTKGAWWFGCYGKPPVLLRADEDFKVTGRWEINAAVGLTALPDGRFLMAENKVDKDKKNTARVRLVRADAEKGLVAVPAP